MITQEEMKSILDYNKKTGIFTWKEKEVNYPWQASWNSRHANKEAFSSIDEKGYKCGSINGKMVKAHRVAWFYVFGTWPDGEVDHINGIKTDNRIDNLRDVSNIDNSRNCKRSSRNKSGVTGVRWLKNRNRWIASIRVNRRLIHIGSYVNFQDAVKARKLADIKYGFHDGHGKVID